MRISLLLAVFCTVAFAAVVKDSSSVGPLSPEKDPRTSLEESIRRMRLSIDRELVYLARMDEVKKSMNTEGMVARQAYPADEETDSTFGGFTDKVNDGTDIFRPIRPGVEVPSAKMFEDSEPEPSEVPSEPPIVTETPGVTDDPPKPTKPPRPSLPIEISPGPGETEEPTPTITDPPIPFPSVSAVPSEEPTPIVPTETPIVDFVTPVPTDLETLTPTPVETEGPVPTFPIPGVIGIEPSPSPDATTEVFLETPVPGGEEDDSVCFPAHATVQLEDGRTKVMSKVELGDRVLVGSGRYSEVFMFTHKMASVRHSFIELLTSSGHRLALTKGHYLYVNDKLAAASTVRKGDVLALGNEALTTVLSVRSIVSTGLYNPQTTHGDIVVNGVRASTYTSSVEPKMAHALLAPLRAVYDSVGFTLSAFEMGADYLASLVPSGSLVN